MNINSFYLEHEYIILLECNKSLDFGTCQMIAELAASRKTFVISMVLQRNGNVIVFVVKEIKNSRIVDELPWLVLSLFIMLVSLSSTTR